MFLEADLGKAEQFVIDDLRQLRACFDAADHLGLRSTRRGLRGGGDSKRQHPRDSDEGSDHAPALLVGESKRGPGPRSLSRSTCLEIHVDRREEIPRSEEHTSELQSLMRISYAVFCLKTKTRNKYYVTTDNIKSRYD